MALAALMSLTAGASLYGVPAFAHSDPGKRPAGWWGWQIMFNSLAIGLPLPGLLPSSFDIESSDARVAVVQKILANRDVQLTVWEDGPDDDDEP